MPTYVCGATTGRLTPVQEMGMRSFNSNHPNVNKLSTPRPRPRTSDRAGSSETLRHILVVLLSGGPLALFR